MNARNAPAQGGDHGLAPETYARTYAALTELMSMHPSTWPAEWRDAMASVFPDLDFGGASA